MFSTLRTKVIFEQFFVELFIDKKKSSFLKRFINKYLNNLFHSSDEANTLKIKSIQ